MATATIEWPSTLPGIEQNLARNYREQQPDMAIRLPTDSGSSLSRPKSNPEPKQLAVNLVMTTEQTVLFEDFYRKTCVRGSQPFNGTHPRTRERAVFKFTTSGYTFSDYNGTDYVTSFDVAILP